MKVAGTTTKGLNAEFGLNGGLTIIFKQPTLMP
jgi:hypothetical protein